MKMTKEQIERLTMDRHHNELSEDAIALLEVYLDEHPATRQWEQDTADICALAAATYARQVDGITGHNEVCLPSVPNRLYFARRFFLQAALIVIAVGGGIFWGRAFQPARPTQLSPAASEQTHVQQSPQKMIQAESDDSESSGSFWLAYAEASLRPSPEPVPYLRRSHFFWPDRADFLKGQNDE